MKHLVLILLFCMSASTFAASSPRPNILLIYTDDHGWADLGAQGVDKDIRTPNLDQLARDGVRFHRGYVTAPQCVPSRAGVISGQHQNRFGVEDNLKGPLPLDVVTVPERLKKAGYVTGMSGKWHLDLTNESKGQGKGRAQRVDVNYLPHAHGFDEYWCGSMRQYHASHDLKGNVLPNVPKLVSDDRFRIVVQTEGVLSFLDRRSPKPEQPWFFYLAWFAPHVPLESPEPWFAKTPAQLPLERRQALAMIAAMDDGLGRIREKLKAMGIEQNTLIFFIGDNGAPTKKGAWDGSLNLPLIGEKGMLTDGGVRVPFVAAWPGKFPAGKTYEYPVSSLDVGATAVALAGLPHDAQLDGVNLMPFVTGDNQAAPHDYLYWRWRSQAAVLNFPWKLIRLGADERFLFDVTQPEGETKNLIKEHPDIAAKLDEKLKTWSDTLKPTGLPTTIVNEDGKFFADHIDKRFAALETANKPKVTLPSDGFQGWLSRNGTLALKDGALVILPDVSAKSAPFITHAALELPGPLTVILRVRAKQGGKSSFAWRTKTVTDFTPENATAFDWPTSTDWQEIKTELPVKGQLIHLRISPAKGSIGLEVQSIQLRPTRGEPQVWRFDKK
jgi:uncharacterized sulfatase